MSGHAPVAGRTALVTGAANGLGRAIADSPIDDVFDIDSADWTTYFASRCAVYF